MDGLRSILPLSPESLRGITPATDIGPPPAVEMVDPRDLFVEDSYQRRVGENGIKLIRRIYAGFSWSRFKPPVCVRVAAWDNVLVCIDGQHTAIAAASHPEVGQIPVLIVSAADAAARANAFVGHNRDRLGLTQMAIYYAELAGGDPIAVKIDQACRDAGATILTKPVNLKNRQPAGATIAVGTIKGIAKTRGGNFLTRVLKVMVAAGRGPMKADEIAATALVLEATPLDDRSPELAKVIGSRSAEAWAASVAQELADKGGSLPPALAQVWSREIGLPGVAPGGTQVAPRQEPVGSGSRLGDAARMMARLPAPSKPATEARTEPRYARVPSSSPAAKAASPTAPAARSVAPGASSPGPGPTDLKTASRQPAPKPAPEKQVMLAEGGNERQIIRNGVTLDLLTREVTHRGRSVRIPRDDGIRLLACLARVMPSLLDESRVIRAAFGSLPADGSMRLQRLMTELSSALAEIRLEVKRLQKIGIRLNDLGE